MLIAYFDVLDGKAPIYEQRIALLNERVKSLSERQCETERRLDRAEGFLIERQSHLNQLKAANGPGSKAPLRRRLSGIFDKHRKHSVVNDLDLKLIEGSGLFDGDWYLSNHPDVANSGVDPAVHYLVHGASETWRSPGPCFDAAFYVESNPDVVAAKANPLVHYLRHGLAEGRARVSVG